MDVIVRMHESTATNVARTLTLVSARGGLTEEERTTLRGFADLLRAARPKLPPLTKQQHEMLTHLADTIEQNGYAPSYAEIAEHFGYKSLGTVHEHLHNLERKGYLRVLYNEARGIVLDENALPARPVVASSPDS